METPKELTQDQKELLRSPLPKEAITRHPTKTYLSSIKAVYVTERLNEVFGIGKWTTKVQEISHDPNGMVVVKVTLEVPEYGFYYESYGGNDNGGTGNKNFDLGDAYKGATTDAITKIGSYLEIGIDVFKGLGDKPIEQIKKENKKEEKEEKVKPKINQKQRTQLEERIKKGEVKSLFDYNNYYDFSPKEFNDLSKLIYSSNQIKDNRTEMRAGTMGFDKAKEALQAQTKTIEDIEKDFILSEDVKNKLLGYAK